MPTGLIERPTSPLRVTRSTTELNGQHLWLRFGPQANVLTGKCRHDVMDAFLRS